MKNINNIFEIIENIRSAIKSWKEWKKALSWAKIHHPSWVYLATQIGRPEIKETYHRKIIRGYCDSYM